MLKIRTAEVSVNLQKPTSQLIYILAQVLTIVNIMVMLILLIVKGHQIRSLQII